MKRSVWAVAAVGMAVGGGLFVAAIGTTILTLLILAGVKPLETHLYGRLPLLTLVIDRRTTSLYDLQSAIEQAGINLDHIIILPGGSPDEDRVELKLRRAKGQMLLALLEGLRHVPGVHEINTATSSPNQGHRSASRSEDAGRGEREEGPED